MIRRTTSVFIAARPAFCSAARMMCSAVAAEVPSPELQFGVQQALPEDVLSKKYTVFPAWSRVVEGSKASRYMRRGEYVPGVLYGPAPNGGNIPFKKLMIKRLDIEREARRQRLSLENTLYELHLDDAKYIVTIRQYQINPRCRMRLPVVYANHDMSIDIRRGCFVNVIQKFLEVRCYGDIPKEIVVDLSGKNKGDVIRASNISIPESVKPILGNSGDRVLAIITDNS